jgi:peptide/nickel transport system ATP-binding protein
VNAPLLEAEGVVVTYRRVAQGLRSASSVAALAGVSFSLERGTTLALVGESGSGKSTLARALLGLVPLDGGVVRYRSANAEPPLVVATARGRELRRLRRELALVFQDPYASLNPRRTVGAALAEPLVAHGLARASEARERAREWLARVGLEPAAAARFPHAFSGGQRQRIAIARALVLGPKLVVLDEAVSALDVSIRAQILTLLTDLQRELGLTYLFITHDLWLARAFAARMAVMERGRIVEQGESDTLVTAPASVAARRLVASVLTGAPR